MPLRNIVVPVYRPLTDEEFAALKERWPDEDALRDVIKWMPGMYLCVAPEMPIECFFEALDECASRL